MASLDHITTVFSDYKYDKDVGFESSRGVPCLGCISEIDRDISCIPSELLGAAQWYWNFVARLENGEHSLTRRQIWRVRRALEACGSAWRELEGHLMNPNNLAILTLQESVASRKTLNLSILQSAGANLPLDEIYERLDAVKPPYALHGNCVVALRNALAHLSISEDVVVGSVAEGKCDSFSDGSPHELTATMTDACGSAANCKVVHNGIPDYPGQ
ncbi:hypothetical protein FDENT_2285 [Fusarium denticulatum]|uniref:Uncharacterized protein n=1 Tax=Fusarium denticulatum TaxID=48507 RepID=A0A8H5XG79_9HYPO|nr:hypothetical protein FDENT_2285 [Fusarium denticulatum]